MGRAELKIYDQGEYFIIKRPRSRINTALCYTSINAEIICAALNVSESAATNRQQLKRKILRCAYPGPCMHRFDGYKCVRESCSYQRKTSRI